MFVHLVWKPMSKENHVHQNDRPQQDTAVLRHGSGLV